MKVLRLLGTGVYESKSLPTHIGMGTAWHLPVDHPMLLVVRDGECTVGDDREVIRRGQAVFVEAGETVNLRATTPELEILHVDFVDRP